MDIREALRPGDFEKYLNAEGSNPVDWVLAQLSKEGITDPPRLMNWITNKFGKVVVGEVVVENLKLGCRKGDPIEKLFSCWFSHRGILPKKPGVRPAELANSLLQLANEVAAAPGHHNAPRLMTERLELLLRYLSLFYAGEI